MWVKFHAARDAMGDEYLSYAMEQQPIGEFRKTTETDYLLDFYNNAFFEPNTTEQAILAVEFYTRTTFESFVIPNIDKQPPDAFVQRPECSLNERST